MEKLDKKTAILRRLFREAVYMVIIQLLVISPSQAKSRKAQPAPTPQIRFTDAEILKQSQISYRAEGGFTGIISYGVIMSCSEGKISILKSVEDPQLVNDDHKRYELATISQEKYLALWKTLLNMNIFVTKDVADPKLDIMDEFTFNFNVRVGVTDHQFKVYGIDRPEASRLFAFKSLIDESVNMAGFWNSTSAVAQKPAE